MELDEGMLEEGGKQECLGLGKPVAFLAVRLGGRWAARLNQFLIQNNNKGSIPLASPKSIQPCLPPSLDQ